jgi:hypothetical protein
MRRRRENIRPKAMKNAAIIRIRVSGPVFVSVIFSGVGVVGTGVDGEEEALSLYDTHS